MALGMLVGGVLLVLVLGLSWRLPALPLILGLVTVAVRPELLLGGVVDQADWGLPRTLLVLALVIHALRHGVRRQINWPVGALVVVLALNLLLGDLHPKLTPLLMLEGLAVLALPFAFASVALAPGSRRGYGLVIALLPTLSAVAGALMQLGDAVPQWGFQGAAGEPWRLAGAVGSPEPFAILAFAGFAAALHEATRPGRPYAGILAIVNLALVILSGTRMAIFASGILLVTYGMLSEDFRDLMRRRRWLTAAAGLAVAVTALLYWPYLQQRLFEGDSGQVQMSARTDIWSFYLEELQLSPLFGRGLGTAYVAGTDWLTGLMRSTPHNEYLHLLVVGGAVGLVLCLAAIVLWYRQLIEAGSANDRQFLLALAPALAIYAFTADLLIYWTGLALYVYLGVLLTRAPAAVRLPEPRRRVVVPPRPVVDPPPPRRAGLFRPEPEAATPTPGARQDDPPPSREAFARRWQARVMALQATATAAEDARPKREQD